MDQSSVTWIVAADAAEARIFCEQVRTGSLHEFPDLHMSVTDEERTAVRHHRAEDRGGQHEPERRFLGRVAARVALGASQGEFEQLVLMGPPRALGLLKMALPPEVLARIDVTDPHERRQDDPDALRQHLRQARARSAS